MMLLKDTRLRWLLPSVYPTLALIITLTQAPCGAELISCTEPSFPALLEALAPMLSLSAIRPVYNTNTSTNVSIYFTMFGIQGVDEKAQLLITNLWLNFEWKNEFASWDPIECGTDKISLPRTKFWVPDVVINEFMDENTAPNAPYVYLYNDGRVFNGVPVRVVSSCNLDIYTFPFDIQNCTLTFNSYLHMVKDIKMSLTRPVEVISNKSKLWMSTLGEWELLDITHSKYIDNDPNSIDMLAFHVRVRRRPTLYVVNLLIPSCFLITVDLFSFLLPPQNVDRSSFKMTLILGYTVFLLIMNDLLPVTGNAIPLINVFFSLCLALMVGSLLETILITKLLYGSENFSNVPRWVQVFILEMLGFLVGLPPKPKEQRDAEAKASAVVGERPEQREAVVEEKAVGELRRLGSDLRAIRLHADKQNGSQNSKDWMQVGFIIDRLLFGVYILFITVSFITIIIIWVNSYGQ